MRQCHNRIISLHLVTSYTQIPPLEHPSTTITSKMKSWIALSVVAVALMVTYTMAEPPSSYGAPSAAYGAPVSSGYGAPVEVVSHAHSHSHAHAAPSSGWAAPAPVSSGWGWRPKVRYLNLRIPIPQLPKIRLGIRAGIKASVSHGWGWRK